MNGISDWFENNWIDLARLLVQLAIFAAVVRYGRKVLATLRASQEQVGALLKLSVADSVAEKAAVAPEPSKSFEAPLPSMDRREPESERRPEPELEPVFAARPSYSAEREQSLGGRVMGAQTPAFAAPAARVEIPALTPWVSAPAMEPERLNIPEPPLPPRPAVSSWLQAPVRSNDGGPWRKVVRWLQEPARR